MSKIILHHHLGMGDHFVCNGLVNYLSQKYDLIYLACKKSNFNTINFLYSDNHKVEVFSIKDSEHLEVKYFSEFMSVPVLRVGFEYCNRNEWNTSFYSQLGIDFSVRYEMFHIPDNVPNEKDIYDLFSKEKYCLVHRESSESEYNLKIDTDLPIVEIQKSTDPYGNLLNYRKLIQNATEIHCVNSSIFHLVDSIKTDANLIYHDIRKRDFKILNKWRIVEYD